MEVAEFRGVPLEELYRDLRLARPAPGRPYTVVNMISTVDGKSTFVGGAGKLGTKIDHFLMRQIRGACDALVLGVGTLRAENVDPRVPEELATEREKVGMLRQPLRVVISASGDVPLDNLFFRVPGDPPMVFVGSEAGQSEIERLKAMARVVESSTDRVSPRYVAAALARDHSVQRMVIEGGPVLTYSALTDGIVDELFLTIAPKIVGGEQAKTIAEGPELPLNDMLNLDLRSVYRDGSELFLRYRVRNP